MSQPQQELSKYAQERFDDNKRAFEDVLGDPFAKPEAITGYYNRMKSRSSIRVADNNFDAGHATGNAARPTSIDFLCDVERVVEDACREIAASSNARAAQNLLHNFIATYITEITETVFTPKQRQTLEQHIGKTFLDRGISPVSSYFKTIRQSVGTTQRGKTVEHAHSNASSRNPSRNQPSL